MSLVACKKCGVPAAVRGIVDKQNWLCVMCAPAPINDTQRLDWLVSNRCMVISDRGEWRLHYPYGKSTTVTEIFENGPFIDNSLFDTAREAIDHAMRSK